MPIYEYHCEKCDKVVEVFQKISDEALTVCPACEEGGSVRKLISRSSFQLKGSGWYATDYARGAAPKADTAEKPSETKTSEAPACGQGACAACSTGAADA